MITLDPTAEHPQGFPIPEGLSVVEAMCLDCELWTPHTGYPDDPGEIKARGCNGFGHYLCLECASLELDSPMWAIERWTVLEDVVPLGWDE